MKNGDNNRWQWISDELAQLKQKSLYRSLSDATILENGWLIRNGRTMLNLASNHYLGLDLHLDGQGEQSVGSKSIASTASRLIVGSDPIYAQFEREFAEYKSTESCLIFSSGYSANVGAIAALVGRDDLVFSDRLNHASIVDGITLSRAEHKRYRNRDLDQLEALLQKAEPSKKKLIVTDSIFSMDGSIAPLRELVELKNRYGAMLMVDEAHSSGVYGTEGQGLIHSLGLADEVDIQMGTYSKAFGCYGAYIAGDKLLIQYLINKARSFIFTTALPPIIIHAIRANWLKVRADNWRREKLQELAESFRTGLRKAGFSTGDSECHIVPLIIGGNDTTLRFSSLLLEAGIAAVAIRPPTVPDGEARIRFTLMATHQREDLDRALHTITLVGLELGLIQ